jgi:hypothetical protein
MRTTRKQIEAKFRNVIEAAGGRVATSYNDVGGFALDHNSVYGGWRIVQITNEAGGERDLCHRMQGSNFWQALDLFGSVLYAIRKTEAETKAA